MAQNFQSVNAVALRILADKTQFESSLKQLNGKLGSFSKGASKLGGVLAGAFAVGSVVALGKQVFEFSQQMGDMQQKVAAMSGATGAALDNLTGKIKGVSDVFGKDFNEVLQGASVLSKQMGISTTAATSLIEKGFAAGADSTGEFMAMLKEYPTQFKAAGLSAEETIAIMTQSIKQGVYSDKGADTIKEATLRLREMTPATADALKMIGISSTELQAGLSDGSLTAFQAIQKVSGKLGELPPLSSKVGTAIADIFGGAGEDAGIEFIKSLSTMELSMDSLIANTTDLQKAQLRLSQASGDLNEVWAKMFGDSSVWFTELKATMTEIAVKAIRWMVDGMVDFINYFIELYNQSILFRGIIASITAYYKVLWSTVKLVFNNIIDAASNTGEILAFVLNPANWGQGFGDKLGALLLDGLGNFTKNYETYGQEVGAAVKTGIDTTLNGNVDLIQKPVWDAVTSDAEDEGALAGKAFAERFNTALTLNLKPIQPSSLINKEATDAFKARVSETMLATTTTVGEGTDLMSQDFDSFLNSTNMIENAIGGIGDATIATVQGAKGAFADLAVGMLTSIAGIVLGLYAKAIAATIAGAAETVPFPPVAIGIAAAGVLALGALWQRSMPAFAEGGIVTGPTVGLIGEKGPEAIIPLNKMGQMQKDLAGQVVFRIQDDQLVGILDVANKKQTYY